MFKVSEVAEKLEVTTQTVYNYLKRIDQLGSHVYKDKKGATVLDIEGIRLIAKELDKSDIDKLFYDTPQNRKTQKTIDPDITELKESIKRIESNYTELVNELREQLKQKDKQLEEKDRLLSKRDELLEQNNNLLQNFQVIVRESQQKVKELEGQTEKKSIWEKLKWWE